jgi:ribonuclease Z
MRHSCRRRRAAVGAALVVTLLVTGCERLVDRQIARSLARGNAELVGSPDLHVVLCGTGSPLPDPARAGPCTAVVAGGELFLVDAGPGSWEVVDLAGLPTGALGGVFLTHFHSDHVGDLGEAIVQSWITGRGRPLEVYGPPGTARIVDGLRAVYAADVEHRVAHHGDAVLPRAAAGAVAREVPLDPGAAASAVVLERGGLRVTMFRVDHAPVEPAVGYRFDYRGRAVVVSGDTRKSASVVTHARGADLLVHEALRRDLVERVPPVAERLGLGRLASMARDIPGYHTTPVEAAEVARDAGVRHLVLTHLVPSPNGFLGRRLFLRGVADVFDGEVTLGEDGAHFRLSPVPAAG